MGRDALWYAVVYNRMEAVHTLLVEALFELKTDVVYEVHHIHV